MYNLPCVEHGLLPFAINDREHKRGASSLQICSIKLAFRTPIEKKGMVIYNRVW